MNEEIKFSLGLDTGPLATGLRKAEHNFKEFKEKSVEGFKDFSKELFASLGAVGSFAILERVFQKVEAINRSAESLGVSTDFIQGLRSVASISQVSADSIERAMDKFAKGLPVGSDVEEEFYKIADSISKTEDPVTRVHKAVEAFGQKLGVQMVPLLARGSAEIKKLAESFDKLTESELKNIEQAHDKFEQTQNTITVWAGKAIVGLQNLTEGVGAWVMTGFKGGIKGLGQIARDMAQEDFTKNRDEKKEQEDTRKAAQADAKARAEAQKMREAADEADRRILESTVRHGTPEQQMAALEKLKEKKIGDLITTGKDEDRQKLIADIDEISRHMDSVQRKLDKEAETRKKIGDEIERAQDAIKETDFRLSQEHRKPGMHTLEELASVPAMGFGSVRGLILPPGAMAARGIVADREAAHQAALWGNFDRADFLLQRADRNFDSLASHDPYLVNPFDQMNRTLTKQEKHLDQIMRRASGADGRGIVVESED